MTTLLGSRALMVMSILGAACIAAPIEFGGRPQTIRLEPFTFFFSQTLTTGPLESAELGTYELIEEGERAIYVPFEASVRVPRLPGRVQRAAIEVSYEAILPSSTYSSLPVQVECDDGPCPYVGHDLIEIEFLGSGFAVVGPAGSADGCTWCEADGGLIELPSDVEKLLDSKRKLHFSGVFFVGFYDAGFLPDPIGFNSKTTLTYKGRITPEFSFTYFAEYEPAPVPEPSTLLAGLGLAAGVLAYRFRRT